MNYHYPLTRKQMKEISNFFKKFDNKQIFLSHEESNEYRAIIGFLKEYHSKEVKIDKIANDSLVRVINPPEQVLLDIKQENNDSRKLPIRERKTIFWGGLSGTVMGGIVSVILHFCLK